MGMFERKIVNLFSFDFLFLEYLGFFFFKKKKMSMMCFGLLIALCLVPEKMRN